MTLVTYDDCHYELFVGVFVAEWRERESVCEGLRGYRGWFNSKRRSNLFRFRLPIEPKIGHEASGVFVCMRDMYSSLCNYDFLRSNT